mmetsp:Transcript_14377/g.22336  ORF Transcript_14377/g.22336 Transcript_14377/m.22336 type:complete len:221 (-) Transcript_14377:196-858(-)
MVDLQGPSIRTGYLKDGKPIPLKKNSYIKIVYDMSVEGDENVIAFSHPMALRVGTLFHIGDGGLQLEVKEMTGEFMEVKIMNDFELTEKLSVNLPSEYIEKLPLTQKDEIDISDFIMHKNIDFVALSLVRRGEDVEKLREALGDHGNNMKIIAKIENEEGIENFDDILQLADGVMIMRKPLSLEIEVEKLSLIQRQMIQSANIMAKTILIGSAIFDSMIE